MASEKVLVVDDSMLIRTQLREFLEEAGYIVEEAADGSQGVAAAKNGQLDLIIVDMNMPVMNGIEMVTEVRKLASHAATPIFMLTTESLNTEVAKGKQAGVTAWIVKPFTPDVLLAGMKKVFARKAS